MPEQHTVAKTIVLNESNQVLVLTRAENRHRPLEPDLPGGGVDPGEGELTAAVREIYEETGITVDPMTMRLDYAKTYMYEGRDISVTKLLYSVRLDHTPDVVLATREHSAYEWLAVEKLQATYSFGSFYDEAISYMLSRQLI